MEHKYNAITEGVIWKQLLLFFFPIVLGTVFQVMYNTVDAIVVGRYVGTVALAAVGGPTGTLINLIVGFFMGVATGCTVVIAQFYGAEDSERANRAVHTAIALGYPTHRSRVTDLPEDGRKPDVFPHASDLIQAIREEGDFCLGAACYPEVHPESRNQKEDLLMLKKKVEAGAEFLTTQMFFDNNLLYNFLYKLREAGVTAPVLPGIMPITAANQVERALKLSGSFMPRRFISLVDRFGGSREAMKQAGIIYATDQIIDLFANGIRHVHVYTMNKPDVAGAILNNLKPILAAEAKEE